MMKKIKGITNVYADLGLENADEMLVKAQLASTISEIIKLRKLTQAEAGDPVLVGEDILTVGM